MATVQIFDPAEIAIANRHARPKGRMVGLEPQRQALINRLNSRVPFLLRRDRETGALSLWISAEEGLINLARSQGRKVLGIVKRKSELTWQEQVRIAAAQE